MRFEVGKRKFEVGMEMLQRVCWLDRGLGPGVAGMTGNAWVADTCYTILMAHSKKSVRVRD